MTTGNSCEPRDTLFRNKPGLDYRRAGCQLAHPHVDPHCGLFT